jgi:transcription initiation factor IIE alpha subunit
MITMIKEKYSFVLSCIAVSFGVVAIITSRPYLLDFNATGVMVSVLCILVTLLVGWNIYKTIETKEEIEKLKSFSEKKIAENEAATNEVKAMLFSVCADILVQNNYQLQAYEYYLYAIRNYLWGKNKKDTIDKTLNKMNDALANVENNSDLQSEEMFYSILCEVKPLLSDVDRKRLEDLEVQRKTGKV